MGEEIIEALEAVDFAGLLHKDTAGVDDMGRDCRVDNGVTGQSEILRPPRRAWSDSDRVGTNLEVSRGGCEIILPGSREGKIFVIGEGRSVGTGNVQDVVLG